MNSEALFTLNLSIPKAVANRKHKRKNYYEVLGVPSVASQLEIKKAHLTARL